MIFTKPILTRIYFTSWKSYVTLHCASSNVGHPLVNVSLHQHEFLLQQIHSTKHPINGELLILLAPVFFFWIKQVGCNKIEDWR